MGISFVAILATSMALAFVSAGRFSPFGPVGIGFLALALKRHFNGLSSYQTIPLWYTLSMALNNEAVSKDSGMLKVD